MSENPNPTEALAPSAAPKRKYTRRQPIRAVENRAEARPEPVREVRTRTRKGGGTDRLHIPQSMIPDGIDLQWVTVAVLGQPAPQIRMSYEVNGWRPVNGQSFGGRFDGMFMPKGHAGEINVEGLVLMERPMELTIEARAEDSKAAREAVRAQERQFKTGRIDGVNPNMLSPDAPNSYNRLTREIVSPMPVPKN